MKLLDLIDDPCPMGCPIKDVILFTGRDLIHGLPGEFNVVKCCTCGLMRTNPRPAAEAIGFYYPDDYGPYVRTLVQHDEKKNVLNIKKTIKSLIKRIYRFNNHRLPKIKPGRLLEIGCASGSFLHHMAQQGWIVEGIEFSEKSARAARDLGYHVHRGPLETAPDPEKSFDLIVGWMVLEHLYDPIGGLHKLYEWSKPGAWLALSVPNAESFEFRLFKDKWYGLHLPNHLYHFTPKTIEMLLNKAGWKTHKIYHQAVLINFIVSTGYVLQGLGASYFGNVLINFPRRSAILNYIFYPISWILSLMGETGRMTILAKREK